MKFIFSITLLVLASFGFMAELLQLDQLSNTELKLIEKSNFEESSENEKKEKSSDEKIIFLTEIELICINFSPAQSFFQTSFTKGFTGRPYYPPDLIFYFIS